MSEENVASSPDLDNVPAQKPKGLSIAGMVLGIVGCVFSLATCTVIIGVILSIIGVILSAVALKKCNEGTADGKGMAIAGLATSIVGIGWAIYIFAIAASVTSELDDAFRELDSLMDKYDSY